MNSIDEKSDFIIQESRSYLENTIPTLKSSVESNISKLRNLRNIFSDRFNDLLLQIEKLPQDVIIEEELSPASIKTINTWEWEYATTSTKNFNREGDLFILNTGMSGSIHAYSSIVMNDDTTLKIKFEDTTSFGCSGFGLISKQDPLFSLGNFSNSGTHPMFCMCCFGPWSAKYMEKKVSENLQHILKRAEEKYVTFQISFTDMMFRVYECSDQLFAEYDLNKLNYKNDLVLLYFTGSSVAQSFEIIYI